MSPLTLQPVAMLLDSNGIDLSYEHTSGRRGFAHKRGQISCQVESMPSGGTTERGPDAVDGQIRPIMPVIPTEVSVQADIWHAKAG